MSDSRMWLEFYPKGVPADINLDGQESLVALIDKYFKEYKDLPAYACMGKTLSFAEVDAKARDLAAYFQSLGLQVGDRVALMMPNILQYPIALFGALRAGLIVVNTNPLYTEREMLHQFKDAGVKAIIIAENFADKLERILPKTEIKHVVVASIGEMLGTLKGSIVNFVVRHVKKMVPKYKLPQAVTFKKALKVGAGASVDVHYAKADDLALIQYTGGTTGVAKGAMITHRNLIANMLQIVEWLRAADFKEGQEVMLTPLPLYHIFSFTVNCLCMASYGSLSVLVTNPRDLDGLVKTMNSYKFSIMTGVNTLFNAMLNHPKFKDVDFSNFKAAVGGAMAVQRAVAERWQKVTGFPITEGYGLTEASPVVCVNPVGNDGRIGTIGMPIPSTHVRVVSEESGKVLGIGERGELQVKGPQVMKGYYKRPEATENTFSKDGWLKTGDVAILDEGGFFRIVDRIKDMILVSGFNVYPNEVEEVVAGHDKVLEVAAVGVPDAKSGEAVKLFVVRKDDSLTEEELRSYCKENLTGYKKPRHIEFRNELPKTNVGKILRRALRDEAKEPTA